MGAASRWPILFRPFARSSLPLRKPNSVHEEPHFPPGSLEHLPHNGSGSQQFVSQEAPRAKRELLTNDRLRVGPTTVPRTSAAKSRKCLGNVLIIFIGILAQPILSVKQNPFQGIGLP